MKKSWLKKLRTDLNLFFVILVKKESLERISKSNHDPINKNFLSNYEWKR